MQGERTNLMIVDALNLAFRWKHQGATIFAEEYVKTVASLAQSYKAKHVIIVSDWGSSTFRKGIYPEYKQNRAEMQAQQTEAEAAYFEVFFEEFLHALDLLRDRYPMFRFKGVEADDIAAFLCEFVQSKYSPVTYDHIWLVSSDRDWDLLVGEKVSRFSYVTRKETTLETWSEMYDFPPEHYASVKAIMGDTGDNVIGVNKIGPKTAAKLIAEYDNVWDLIANMPLPGKYVYIKNLNEFGAEKLAINAQLVDLVTYCKDAVGEENINIIKETLEAL